MYRLPDELVEATHGMLAFEQTRDLRIDPKIELRGWCALKIDIDNDARAVYGHNRMISRFERGNPMVEIQVVLVGVRGNDEAHLYKIEATYTGPLPEQQGQRCNGYWREVNITLDSGMSFDDWDPMPPIRPALKQTGIKVRSVPESIDERDVKQLEAAIEAIEKSE